MPSFRWSAINSGGEVVHGLSDAADRASVVERLQRQGQIVLRAEPAGRRALADLLHIELVTRRGLDRAALAEVTNELATMLAAGQDLDRALRVVFENAQHAKERAILGEVRGQVRGGSSVAAADAVVAGPWPRRCRGSAALTGRAGAPAQAGPAPVAPSLGRAPAAGDGRGAADADARHLIAKRRPPYSRACRCQRRTRQSRRERRCRSGLD